MNIEEAGDLVRRTLHEVAPDADLDNLGIDADLRDDLALDSLDFLRFVELLSDRTGVRIEEDEYPELASLGSAIRFVAGHVPATNR